MGILVQDIVSGGNTPESMYAYDLHPSVQYHLHIDLLLMIFGTIIVVTDSSLAPQGDLNDASQLSSTHLPASAALEDSDSIPAERDGQLGNMAAETIVQGVQETSLTSRVPLIVGGFGNGISPYTDEPGLDQVSNIFNPWQLLQQQSFPRTPTNILIPAHQCSRICRTFHYRYTYGGMTDVG
jgi:hypothetical protein